MVVLIVVGLLLGRAHLSILKVGRTVGVKKAYTLAGWCCQGGAGGCG